ncbi:MAG TPA: serine/threonine-protein kinase [Gemmatales bacterium]|nr:serine/threonine-protein kinase [Gemmatales bacterium]
MPSNMQATEEYGPEISIGFMVAGRYKLIEQLGEGGMGTVYVAEQVSPVKREVALKLIKPGMDSRAVIARFEAERQALAMMNHPHIAKMLDGGMTQSGQPYFVMELVKGLSITKYCDQYHLTLEQRLELFVSVCHAVEHAHQKGIIHRDLKPSNILVGLVDGKPCAKIIDFGVAKALHQKLTDRTLHTSVGSIVGTLEYMAPEQAELNNLDIDTRADIYALGVVLYELLASSPPFSRRLLASAAFDEILRIIREVEPQKPSTRLQSSDELPAIAASRKTEPRKLVSTISGELDAIVMKCLEKDRNNRYSSPTALSQDLTNWINGDSISIKPLSGITAFWRWLKRNVQQTLLVIFTATLLGAVTGIIYLKQGIGQNNKVFDYDKSYLQTLAISLEKTGQERPWYIAWNWWDSVLLSWLNLPYVTITLLTLIYGCGGLVVTLVIPRKSSDNELSAGLAYGLVFGMVLYLTAAGPAWLVNSTISPTFVTLRSMALIATENPQKAAEARNLLFMQNSAMQKMSEEDKFAYLFVSMLDKIITGIISGLWLGVTYTLVLFSSLAIYQSLIAGYLVRAGLSTKQIILNYFEKAWPGTLLVVLLTVYVAGTYSGAEGVFVMWRDETGRKYSFMVIVLILWMAVSWCFLDRKCTRYNTQIQLVMFVCYFGGLLLFTNWIASGVAILLIIAYLAWIGYGVYVLLRRLTKKTTVNKMITKAE